VTIRIGLLGAARIAPNALLRPARLVSNVRVTAVAARDPARATAFAQRWGVPTVHSDYSTLLADPDLDAVYIPLPNGLHAEWMLAALAAGKHVLCEKPFTSNAAQAQSVADAAAGTNLVVMEAFHYRYHPLMARALSLVADGTIGEVRHVETRFCFPLPRFSDIRYNLALAGGALMDAGCYAVHCLRQFGPDEPRVVSARALLQSPGVDRAMTATLAFGTGATGAITCSMWSHHLLAITARILGSDGELRIRNFLAPQYYHRLTVRSGHGRWSEKVPGEPTYVHQLRAFAAAVEDGAPILTPPSDAVKNMTVIDAIYQAAGLPLRGESPGESPGESRGESTKDD
jgi:predicted dehydrogenase